MAENVAFVVRQAAEKLRDDARYLTPGGWDEAWRVAVADSWAVVADEMELYGARVVPFIGNRGMDPDAVTIVVGASGRGNAVWTATATAARVYLGKEPGGSAD